MIKYLAIFLILFTTPAFSAEITCAMQTSYTAVYNQIELQNCIDFAQAQPEKTAIIPASAGFYRITQPFVIPEGITVKGETSGGLVTEVYARFDVRSNATVENIVFKNNTRSIIIGEDSVQTGVTIKDCTFTDACWIDSIGNPTGTCWGHIIATRMNDSLIDNNTFNNNHRLYPNGQKPGQNFVLGGGQRNRITNNYTYGGLTSLLFASNWTTTGPTLQIWDNYIGGNDINRGFEEGISFDIHGDSRDAVAAMENDTIASVGTNSLTLTHANWIGTSKDFTGYSLVFVDGNLIGNTRLITSHSGNSFVLDETISGASAGDEIVIGMTFENNVIENNTIDRGWPSILLYGMAFNNRIVGNTVTGSSIVVRSLDDLMKSTGTVTNTCGRAPCGYNLVENNTVGNNIAFQFHDSTTGWPENPWPCVDYSRPAYDSYGNTAIGNTITNTLSAYRQYFFRSGNTGSESFTNSTLLDANPISDDEPTVPGFPGFPTYVNIVDDFNRADGAIGASWTSPVGGFAVSSNSAVGTAGDNNSIYNVASYTDFEFHATIANHSLSYGLYFRTAIDREYGYFLGTHGTGYLSLRRFWNTWANSVDIGEHIPITLATGHKIGVRAVGGNFTIWHDPGTGWVQIATRADSTYASGYVGMVSHNTTMAFDDFGIVSPLAGFPGHGVLDTFDRANGALGSNWTVEDGTIAIATNKVAASTVESTALWHETFTDCEAYMTLSTVAQDETAIIYLRASSDNGYAVTFTSDAVEQTINIYSIHAGWAESTLLDSATVAIAEAGDKVGARVDGTTITVFYDSGNGWSEVFSEINTDYASGKVGFGLDQNGAVAPTTTIDDFGGGGVAAYGPGTDDPNIGRYRTPGIGIIYNPRGLGIRPATSSTALARILESPTEIRRLEDGTGRTYE